MSGKKIILFVIGILLFGALIISKRGLTIKNVMDGSTVELNNGALVTILGVNPTAEGEEYLKKLRKEKIEVVADSKNPFSVKSMKKGKRYYAYIRLKRGGSPARQMLLSGKSSFNSANVTDSLDNFNQYASAGPDITPQIKPKVIDYEEDDIVLPPYQNTERKHHAWYTDGTRNIAMLEDACDFNLPYTKTFANKLAARSAGPYNIGQVCEIFDYCYNNWSYVNDPSDSEYVARASESINSSLSGDCDDFAVLVASCILAIGGRPCINTGENTGGGHAFTEVDISQWNQNDVLKEIKKRFPAYNITSLATRPDGNHLWLNLDWQASYPGGRYYDCSLGRDTYPYLNGQWTWKKLN
ncbi:MAG: transglutaminase-like domain-containing protein [Muribaculaceae bacterium]|nr:transglutaminase-like domain-containing protein [Muribaculaceae bacterium]